MVSHAAVVGQPTAEIDSARWPARGSAASAVADLRRLAQTDCVGARDLAWAWLSGLGEDVVRDHRAGLDQLDRVFAAGVAPDSIDGDMDGIMLAYLLGGAGDRAMRRIGSVWTPWLGKSFDAERRRGENRVVQAFPVFTRLVWPSYALRAKDGERRGFELETYVDRGAVEPRVRVLVVDYGRARSNPRRIVPRIRDELVAIVPGTYLGRWLWRRRNGVFRNVAYFALHDQVA